MKYKLKTEVKLNKEAIDQMGKEKSRGMGDKVLHLHMFSSGTECPPGVLKIVQQRKDFNTTTSSKHLKR